MGRLVTHHEMSITFGRGCRASRRQLHVQLRLVRERATLPISCPVGAFVRVSFLRRLFRATFW